MAVVLLRDEALELLRVHEVAVVGETMPYGEFT